MSGLMRDHHVYQVEYKYRKDIIFQLDQDSTEHRGYEENATFANMKVLASYPEIAEGWVKRRIMHRKDAMVLSSTPLYRLDGVILEQVE